MDDFTLLFQALVLLAAVVVVLLSHGEMRRSGLPAGEYHFLLLASITGALLLAAGRDLITLVVALETLSLPVFALVALRRRDGVAGEAALKLFLVSVVSSAVTLFGISLVYGVTGAMYLDRVAAGLAHVPADLKPVAAAGRRAGRSPGSASRSRRCRSTSGRPDVYEGAPLPVAAFLSVVSKAGGFAGLTLVLTVGFWPLGGTWGPLMGVLAAATMTLGNLVALRQRDAVRLLAWSSVAQSGYMLAPLAGGARVRLHESMTATAAYVADVRDHEHRRLRGRRRRRRGAAAVTWTTTAGLVRANPALAAALAFFLHLPGRPAARRHGAVRQGRGLPRRHRRRRHLARRGHGGQHRDRALLLPRLGRAAVRPGAHGSGSRPAVRPASPSRCRCRQPSSCRWPLSWYSTPQPSPFLNRERFSRSGR